MLREIIREINRKRFREYIYGFTKNIRASFVGALRWPWCVLHLLAILISAPLVLYGIDWSYFLFFRNHKILQLFLFQAILIGGLIPFVVPPIIYLFGKKENRPSLEPLAYALTQAAVVGIFWISIYKAFTGRLGPELSEELNGDYSMDFAIGFLRRGVFDGWPSAHAGIAWAMATVFYCYRPELGSTTQTTIVAPPKFLQYRVFGFIYAFYVSFGVSSNIHWLSDSIAGVLIGISVGLSVSNTFKTKWKKEDLILNRNAEIFWVFLILFLLVVFSIIGFDDL